MGSHKHGVYSFMVRIERIKAISGDEFVAEVTKLRRHAMTGAAEELETPNLPEQYGETASDAEGLAVDAMRAWLTTSRMDLFVVRRRRSDDPPLGAVS